MSRGLWFVAGAGAGVYAMVRGRRAAEALTAEGLRDRWNSLAVGARMLRDEVAQGRAEAEPDLRARFGAPGHGPAALAPGTSASTPPAVGRHRADTAPEDGRAPASEHPDPTPRSPEEGSP